MFVICLFWRDGGRSRRIWCFDTIFESVISPGSNSIGVIEELEIDFSVFGRKFETFEFFVGIGFKSERELPGRELEINGVETAY